MDFVKTIVIALLFIFFAACTKPQQASSPPAPTPVVEQKIPAIPKVRIDHADRACTKDSDCAGVTVSCACFCQEAVNARFVQKYSELQQKLCEDYKGVVCDLTSCHVKLVCQDKVCTVPGVSFGQ